jgi:predicted double-glycine peptidase
MIKLKIFRQKMSAYCGPAALRIIFYYYGLRPSEEAIAKKAGTTFFRGTSHAGMKRAVKSFGWYGFWKERGRISDLRHFVRLKRPVIVDWFSVHEGHYSVVAGISKKFIFLADPELPTANKLPVEIFKKIWFDFDGSSIKKPGQWHFEWLMAPTPEKTRYKIKGNYF